MTLYQLGSAQALNSMGAGSLSELEGGRALYYSEQIEPPVSRRLSTNVIRRLRVGNVPSKLPATQFVRLDLPMSIYEQLIA
jgi:hypothetical protein